MDKHASQKYLTQQLMSASPAKLVAMLYDRAISLLNDAIGGIEAGDTERRWRANKKATEVICHLWETLDMERGGDVAANLSHLYGFMLKRLLAVDIENNAAAALEVIRLLEPLRRSWHDMAKAQAAPAETPANAATPTKISLSA